MIAFYKMLNEGFNVSFLFFSSFKEGDLEDPMGKAKQQDNPFIEPSQQHAVVDMKGKFLYCLC